MKVLVLGSGVIGVTTAHYLARAGHEVTVVDRQREPRSRRALPTRAKFLRAIRRPGRRRVCRSRRSSGSSCATGRSSSGRCSTRRCGSGACASCAIAPRPATTINKNRMLRLARIQPRLPRSAARRHRHPLRRADAGHAAALPHASQVDGAAADMAILERFGVRHELLDRAGCVRAEPALARVQQKIAGGLRLPGDETGDCFKFTQSSRADRGAIGRRVSPGRRTSAACAPKAGA